MLFDSFTLYLLIYYCYCHYLFLIYTLQVAFIRYLRYTFNTTQLRLLSIMLDNTITVITVSILSGAKVSGSQEAQPAQGRLETKPVLASTD